MQENKKKCLTRAAIIVIAMAIYKLLDLRFQRNMFGNKNQFVPDLKQELDAPEHVDRTTVDEIVNA